MADAARGDTVLTEHSLHTPSGEEPSEDSTPFAPRAEDADAFSGEDAPARPVMEDPGTEENAAPEFFAEEGTDAADYPLAEEGEENGVEFLSPPGRDGESCFAPFVRDLSGPEETGGLVGLRPFEADGEEGAFPAEGGAFPEKEREKPPSAPSEAPQRLIGVRLRPAGQEYFFPDNGLTVRVGTKVVVDLEQGPALGEVASLHEHKGGPLPDNGMPGVVSGLATARDIAMHAENRILTAEAAAFCKTCIRQRGLDMKLVDVEVLHDRAKIIFFFTAPARIDFRELVKDLVRMYRTRIELRQIGVRHETQMVGGLGNCGMVCCCHKYLRRFAPVTIKMAKEQNLFLNPAKLSGMCGRLLCCLSFEQSNYEEFNGRCPKLGKKYVTTRGVIRVIRANMFSQTICGALESGEEAEFTLEEWEALQPHRMEQGQQEHRPAPPPRQENGEPGAPGGGTPPRERRGGVPPQRRGRRRRDFKTEPGEPEL